MSEQVEVIVNEHFHIWKLLFDQGDMNQHPSLVVCYGCGEARDISPEPSVMVLEGSDKDPRVKSGEEEE